MKLRDFKKIDKQTHFGWGGMICSFFTLVAMLQDIHGKLAWIDLNFVLIGIAATFVCAVIKELMDEKFEWDDIIATMCGCVTTVLAVFFGILFNIIQFAD